MHQSTSIHPYCTYIYQSNQPSSFQPSIHRRECGSYPSSLRLRSGATPTTWTSCQFIAWPHGKTNTRSQTYTHFTVPSLPFMHVLALWTTDQLAHSWGHFSFFYGVFSYGHPRAITALGRLRVGCSGVHSLPHDLRRNSTSAAGSPFCLHRQR